MSIYIYIYIYRDYACLPLLHPTSQAEGSGLGLAFFGIWSIILARQIKLGRGRRV